MDLTFEPLLSQLLSMTSVLICSQDVLGSVLGTYYMFPKIKLTRLGSLNVALSSFFHTTKISDLHT